MVHQISLKNEVYPRLKSVPPLEVLETSIKSENSLIEKEDYLIIGSDIYLRLNALLYLIGRFAITEVASVSEYVSYLAHSEKKKYSGYNDERLPSLDDKEQEWNDYMLQAIYSNSKFLGIERSEFLHEVYKAMNIDFESYKKKYLKQIKMEDIERITKFRIITCTPYLRRLFEEAMNEVLAEKRAG